MNQVSTAGFGSARRDDSILQVENLSARFPVRRGLFGKPKTWIHAVDDVSFVIRRGETLGLVGESGCGKSTLGRTVLGLNRAFDGKVVFEGRSVFGLKPEELKALRRDMQLVFQDPFASLDPHQPVGRTVRAGLDIHRVGSRADREDMVADMFRKVGLPSTFSKRFPHEFSGGQRQRIGIARALILRPKLVICDEPVSALDVSIQAQILNLLKDLQEEFQLTYLFVSHNLAVVEYVADRVAVMYYGKIVELGDRSKVFSKPGHPYTKSLLSAVPRPDPRARNEKIELEGDPPDPANLPSGCRYRSRCPVAVAHCEDYEPPLRQTAAGHQVACWLAE